MMKTKNKNRRTLLVSEKGNVFFFILLAVVLFGALSYMVARSMRSQNITILTERQAELAASDIISYAQKLELGVNKIVRQGVSETEISFEHPNNAYLDTNANCVTNNCKLYHLEGGGVMWQAPPTDATDMSWNYTKNHKIPGYGGTGHAGLVLHLPGLSEKLCEVINRKLGYNFSSIPEETGSMAATPFDGNYANGNTISCAANECDEKISMCINFSGNYGIAGTPYGSQYVFYYGLYILPD